MRHRICLFGTGRASTRHVEVIRSVEPTASVSVASRDAGRAAEFRRHHGLDRAYPSYEAGMAGADDIAVVATPPLEHGPLTRAALAAGKHVLVEKPAFSTLDEFDDLWPALQATSKVVMVGENQHFAPQAARLVQALRRGDLGRPVLVQVTHLMQNPLRTWRSDPDQLRLGALHETGVHWIRRLLQLTSAFAADPATDVLHVQAAAAANRTTPTLRDETVVVLAHHASGALSQLTHSWGIAHRSGLLDPSRVLCEDGAVYFDVRGRWGVELTGGRRWPTRLFPPERHDRNGEAAMWAHFLGCVDGRHPPALTMADAYADVAYLDAAYRSLDDPGPKVPASPPGR